MIIRGLRPSAFPQHLLERGRPPMFLQEIAERFLGEFLDALHPIFGEVIQRDKMR